jgi:hypothetical protein
MDQQVERMRLKADQSVEDYDLTAETFVRWVPAGYDGSQPYGLLVWVSPSPRGEPRGDWLEVMERHKLIWIAANNAGNPRHPFHRFGLALDALHNMTQQYTIDPQRIYVGGMSGGGRVASRMGLIWADLFNGALMNDGVDFYRILAVPDKPDHYWRPRFNPPPPEVFNKARQQNRYVLITGENDGNRDQTYVTYGDGYKRGGFRHVTYFEVPGKGHEQIDAEWFEKCVIELDKPLTEPPPPPEGAAGDAEAEPSPEQAEEEKARQQYELAVNYLRAGMHDLAVKGFKHVIEDFPNTKYAKHARDKLNELE